ncbi:hypothetical protein MRX96_015733 [Rhipicephalus microplus]
MYTASVVCTARPGQCALEERPPAKIRSAGVSGGRDRERTVGDEREGNRAAGLGPCRSRFLVRSRVACSAWTSMARKQWNEDARLAAAARSGGIGRDCEELRRPCRVHTTWGAGL